MDKETNDLRRTIYFSSKERKDVIEARLADMAATENYTIPAIIEKCLWERLVPQNPIFAAWVGKLYERELTVQQVLELVFEHLAVYRLEYQTNPGVDELLRQIYLMLSLQTGELDIKLEKATEFFNYCNTVIELCKGKGIDTSYLEEATEGKATCETFTCTCSFIIEHFDRLKTHSVVYHLVACMIVNSRRYIKGISQCWEETAEMRVWLVDSLMMLSKN